MGKIRKEIEIESKKLSGEYVSDHSNIISFRSEKFGHRT